MIGLIVTGHANFGSGMTSSVNLIAGEQEAYRYVDFLPTYGTEELTEEIAKAMDELKDCEGIIIFTDLMGGSPFNVAASLGHGKENVRIMDELDGLVESVLETGKEQVTKYEFKQVVQEESEDGI